MKPLKDRIARLIRKPTFSGEVSAGEPAAPTPTPAPPIIHKVLGPTNASDLNELAAHYGFNYERQVLPDNRVRLTAYFTDGDALVGIGMTTAEAVTALASRLKRLR